MKLRFNKGLALFLSTAIWASCTVELTTPEKIKFEVLASCGQTKTTVNDYIVSWEDNDKLSVFAGAQYGEFIYESEDRFTGTLPSLPGLCDWYAVYPWNENNISATGITINIPGKFMQDGNDSHSHLAGDGLPLWGRAIAVPEGGVPEIQMHHIASFIRFRIINKEAEPLIVKSIEFSVPVAANGTFTADLTTGTPVWSNDGEVGSTIRLDVSNGVAIYNDQSADFYVGTLPFSASGTYKLNIEGISNGVEVRSEKTFDKELSFNPGKIRTLNYSFVRVESTGEDEEETQPEPEYYEKVSGALEDWAGTYLIVSNGYAFSSSEPSNRFKVSISDGKILSTPEVDKCAVTMTEAGSVKTVNKKGYNLNTNGQYMYSSDGAIHYSPYTTNYPHVLEYDNGVVIYSIKNNGKTDPYYLGYADNAFSYKSRATERRVELYRIDKAPETPEEPVTPDIPRNKEVYNLESSHLKAYLDEAYSVYDDENWSSVSVVSKYYKSRTGGVGYDVPTPVTLSWLGYPDVTKMVTIYNDASRTDYETSVTTSGAYAEIYNLIPGREYWYSVTTTAGDLVSSGHFLTEGRRRQIKISDNIGENYANNCRDLAGLKTEDGHRLRYGVIYRGSNMTNTSTQEREYIMGYMNVGADINLRQNSSYSTGGSYAGAVFDQTEVQWSHAGYNSFTDLTTPSKIQDTFGAIIDCISSRKAAYIHCYVGADRTGYVCMLIEAACGVSIMDCSIDYEITSLSIVGLRDRNGAHSDYYFTDGLEYILSKEGSTFKEKAERVLLDMGISIEQISALQEALIE